MRLPLLGELEHLQVDHVGLDAMGLVDHEVRHGDPETGAGARVDEGHGRAQEVLGALVRDRVGEGVEPLDARAELFPGQPGDAQGALSALELPKVGGLIGCCRCCCRGGVV